MDIKNKNPDNQESYFNNRTEKATNTKANTETTNGESGLKQHANKFHSDGVVAAKRMEMEEENSEQTTKEAVNAISTTIWIHYLMTHGTTRKASLQWMQKWMTQQGEKRR